MRLIVNGKELKTQSITVMELLKELKIEKKTMAVAVNMEIVKKEKWDSHKLNEGEEIEFLHFVGGG